MSSERSEMTISPIVGGALADADPAVVAILPRRRFCPSGHDGGPFCSGVLVAPRVVLTAAHCVHGRAPAELEVLVGPSYVSLGSIERAIEIKEHASFDPDS